MTGQEHAGFCDRNMTPAIARCVAKYYKEEKDAGSSVLLRSTFINETDYQGKLKEITQIGAELINDPSVEADTEMIALTVECLLEAGLTEFQVEIGQADFFRALVEEAQLSADEIDLLRNSIIDKNTFWHGRHIGKQAINDNTKRHF